MKRRLILMSGVLGVIVTTAAITWSTAIAFLGNPSSNINAHSEATKDRARFSSEITSDGDRMTAPTSPQQASPHTTKRGGRDFNRNTLAPIKPEQHLFKEAAEVAATSGDFTYLARFFDGLSQSKRTDYFKEVALVFSKLGPSHDIREKLLLLDKINTDASSLEAMRLSILECEALERYDSMKQEGVFKKITDKEFSAICSSIAMNRVGKAFAAVQDAGSDSAMRAAAASVAQNAMAGGTVVGSEAIGELPAGVIRDEAVAELVLWLRQSGSEEEAAPWLGIIQDAKAKARAMGD